jgi:uncharacterized protein (DUF58 family)
MVMDVKTATQTATQIAQSQYVFGILFILLFLGVILAAVWLFRNLRDENAEREAQLKAFYDEQRAESREREKRLMEHLDKTTGTLEKIQQGVAALESSVKDVWDEVKFLKRSGM